MLGHLPSTSFSFSSECAKCLYFSWLSSLMSFIFFFWTTDHLKWLNPDGREVPSAPTAPIYVTGTRISGMGLFGLFLCFCILHLLHDEPLDERLTKKNSMPLEVSKACNRCFSIPASPHFLLISVVSFCCRTREGPLDGVFFCDDPSFVSPSLLQKQMQLQWNRTWSLKNVFLYQMSSHSVPF